MCFCFLCCLFAGPSSPSNGANNPLAIPADGGSTTYQIAVDNTYGEYSLNDWPQRISLTSISLGLIVQLKWVPTDAVLATKTYAIAPTGL